MDGMGLNPIAQRIITEDLIQLMRQKTRLHPKTVSFIYDWISFGGDSPEFEQEVWKNVCLSQNPGIKLYRAADRLHPGAYTSWTKSIDAARKFAENKGAETKIYEIGPQNGAIRYYPLCDVANNLDSRGSFAEDEYLSKSETEQEYIVLEQEKYCGQIAEMA